MKRMMKRVGAAALCLCLFAISVTGSSAQQVEQALSALSVRIASEHITGDLFETYETGQQEEIAVDAASLSVKAKSAVLMEVSTGKVLYELNPDNAVAPASITKIMSLLLIVEALEAEKIGLDDMVTASETASSMGGSQIWLKVGETMTVHELLKAVTVASANDACVALAEHIAGSVEEFVARMNQRAKELGAKNTVFHNCTGLDADGHMTTARDVAIMSAELIRHKLIHEYTQIWIDYLRNGETQLVNTNKLVRFYEGTTGLKTGTTSKAGYCLSATAERDGMQLVAVVMGGESGSERFNGAKRMLNYGFANWCLQTPQADLSQILPVQVLKGRENSVCVSVPQLQPVLLKKGKAERLTCHISLPETVQAPVVKGQKLGTLTVKNADKTVATYDLCATQEVKRMSFFLMLKRLLQRLAG